MTNNQIKQVIRTLRIIFDNLIIHGSVTENQINLQNMISSDYLKHWVPQVRQVAIEGIIKMLFSMSNGDVKNNESQDPHDRQEGMINILATLILQWFDCEFCVKKSLSRQILTVFFQNF